MEKYIYKILRIKWNGMEADNIRVTQLPNAPQATSYIMLVNYDYDVNSLVSDLIHNSQFTIWDLEQTKQKLRTALLCNNNNNNNNIVIPNPKNRFKILKSSDDEFRYPSLRWTMVLGQPLLQRTRSLRLVPKVHYSRSHHHSLCSS